MPVTPTSTLKMKTRLLANTTGALDLDIRVDVLEIDVPSGALVGVHYNVNTTSAFLVGMMDASWLSSQFRELA